MPADGAGRQEAVVESQKSESEYRRLASSGYFVEAVRLYRRQHGGSLEEAWDAVERLAAPVVANTSGLPVRDPAVAVEIDALIRAGQKIMAIKRLREATSVGLKEAKDVIDARAVELGESPRGLGGRRASRSGCFVATAAYGDPDAPEVVALRRFRDRVLRRSRSGRFLIRLYYRLSPPLAASLAHSEAARALARRLLAPAAACCAAGLRSRQPPAAR